MLSEAYVGQARARLEEKIETGRKSALALFERVNAEAPKDALVKGKALEFIPEVSRDGLGQLKVNGRDQIRVRALGKEGSVTVHKHALTQLASRAEIPSAYLAEMASGGGWKTQLASEILTKHYHYGAPQQRFLTRTVQGELRGFLSDKYRRLDSRPLIEAFAGECQRIGAVPVDGTASDVRVALKALVPTVYEPVPGEVMAFGIEWANSDYGAGTHSIRAFMLRLMCLNGATLENAMAQVHLGSKLSDEIELSQRTYELDTRTSISALKDVVSSLLTPKAIEKLMAGIQAAQDKGVEWKNVQTKLKAKLLKSELDAARAAFESEDVINLPAGWSVWRASNALSWLAGKAQDADRKLELERVAGELISGKAEVLEAA